MKVRLKVFNSEEIRDTSAHNSSLHLNTWDANKRKNVVDTKKTIIYKNGLNEAVSLQIQGSVDEAFTDPVDINVAISAAASMSKSLYDTFSDYFPFLRIEATCSAQPASGSLDAWILP